MKLLAACSRKLLMSADSMKTRDINSVLCAAGSTTTTVAFIKLETLYTGKAFVVTHHLQSYTALSCPVLS
jgi:hypothetical protein